MNKLSPRLLLFLIRIFLCNLFYLGTFEPNLRYCILLPQPQEGVSIGICLHSRHQFIFYHLNHVYF